MAHSDTVEIIREEILKVLERQYFEELNHRDMKIIADQAARFSAARIHDQSK